MEVIILKNSTERSKIYRLGRYYPAMALLVLTLVICSAFYIGRWSGAENSPPAKQQAAALSGQEIEALKTELAQLKQQHTELEVARTVAEDLVDHFVHRVGRLQAHIIRLEALGSRLSEIANIEQSEFEWSAPPPQGGPLEGEHLFPQFEINAQNIDKFGRALDSMLERLENKEQQLNFMESFFVRNHVEQQSEVAGRPVQSGWVSSRFGRRSDPFTGKFAYHSGVDIAGKQGTEIIAVADGIVTWSGDRWAYGLMIELDHGKGYTTRYAHASKLMVEVGERVKKGQVIALMGSTGRSTGTHLHFEVRKDGKATDPSKYMQRRS